MRAAPSGNSEVAFGTKSKTGEKLKELRRNGRRKLISSVSSEDNKSTNEDPYLKDI